jgi:hypothetical protein
MLLRILLAGLISTFEQLVDLDAGPSVPVGWKVQEHQKGSQFEWNPTKVKLHLSPDQERGNVIEGDKLREELKGQSVYNANLLDYLLKNQHLIPEEWKGKYIFFWGTIYRDSKKNLCVRCLCWHRGAWRWHYGWLASDFLSNDPAAVRAL